MVEKHWYAGRVGHFAGCEPSKWVYFTAYNDSDAQTEFYRLTGCSINQGMPVEIRRMDDAIMYLE